MGEMIEREIIFYGEKGEYLVPAECFGSPCETFLLDKKSVSRYTEQNIRGGSKIFL
jgi:hypothetical protein